MFAHSFLAPSCSDKYRQLCQVYNIAYAEFPDFVLYPVFVGFHGILGNPHRLGYLKAVFSLENQVDNLLFLHGE
jgi:hypothetical protein